VVAHSPKLRCTVTTPISRPPIRRRRARRARELPHVLHRINESDAEASMEFVYDDTRPLVALLLLILAAPIGWLVARRLR
jgi:hypothetical protein